MSENYSGEQFGYAVMKGAMKYLGKCAFVFSIIIICLNLILKILGVGTDSTDESQFRRSGLRVYRDAATGIEYIGTQNGGLTVRLDENGNPLTHSSLR